MTFWPSRWSGHSRRTCPLLGGDPGGLLQQENSPYFPEDPWLGVEAPGPSQGVRGPGLGPELADSYLSVATCFLAQAHFRRTHSARRPPDRRGFKRPGADKTLIQMSPTPSQKVGREAPDFFATGFGVGQARF